MNKFIRFILILSLHKKVVFFFCLLISFKGAYIKGQELSSDRLKKVSKDSLGVPEEQDDLSEKISYEAQDSIVAMALGQKIILYGKSKLFYGGLTVEAEIIEMDYSKNLLVAYGKIDSLGKNYGIPVFKDGEQEISAEKIMYNLKTKRGKIFGALTRQGEMLVYGNEIKKDSNNVIYLKGMKCIPCQEEDSRTMFRATKAKIIPDDKIVTGPMYLEIGGAPTPIALPFGFFPNARKGHNGILIPTFGHSANQGYFLRDGGYYWGINDKTDMTIRGDIFSNGSWGIRTLNTYNLLYQSTGFLNLKYNQYVVGDADVPSQSYTEKSYEVIWRHVQDNKSNPTVRFTSDVKFVKNQYNKYNSFTSADYLTNTFQSNINYTKSFKWSSLSINATQDQNTITREMDVTLPALTFNINRFYPFRTKRGTRIPAIDKIGVNYLLLARNSIKGTDTTLFKGNIGDSLKYGIKQNIPIVTNFNLFKYITVTPGLNTNIYMYTKTIDKQYLNDIRDTVVTNTVKGYSGAFDYQFTTGLNTKLYFDFAFKEGAIKQIRYLMIPTLSYIYNPDFGDPKYGYWKSVQIDTTGKTQSYSIYQKNVYGGPSRGEQNALSINIGNNIEAKLKQKTDSGYNYTKTTILQDLSVFTAYNFAADSFNMSTINLSARSKLFKYFDVVATAVYDPYAYNREGIRLNEFAYNYDGKLANFRTAYFTVNSTFGSNMLEAIKKTRQPPNMTNSVERGASTIVPGLSDKVTWNVSAYYNLTLDNTQGDRIKPIQTLNFRGDIMPTKYWKLGITSGYDFKEQTISYTSINIHRDLKCWEVAIDCVPFGFNKRYSVYLNLKMPALSNIRIPRQKGWYDNIQ